MKKIFLTALFVALSLYAFSQEFELPNYKIENAEDCDKYNDVFLNATNWLMHNSPKDEEYKRLKIYQFLFDWMDKTEAVTIILDDKIVNFGKPNIEVYMIFLCGYSKYALDNNDNINKVAKNIAGVELAIDYYKKYKNVLEKDKNIENYIKMQNDGTLKEFIRKNTK